MLPNKCVNASLIVLVAHLKNTQKQAKDPTEELHNVFAKPLKVQVFKAVQKIRNLRALGQKCGSAYWIECYLTEDSP